MADELKKQTDAVAAQAEELMLRVNLFLHTIETWKNSGFDNPHRLAGYRQAMEEMRSVDELQAMREASAAMLPALQTLKRNSGRQTQRSNAHV